VISDVLSEALANIEEYEREHPGAYGDPMFKGRLSMLKVLMRNVQVSLDMSPASAAYARDLTRCWLQEVGDPDDDQGGTLWTRRRVELTADVYRALRFLANDDVASVLEEDACVADQDDLPTPT